MNLLMPDTGLLFWMLLSFGIVFFILAKYGFPVITKMVEERKTYIEKSLDAAQQANQQMEQIQAKSEAIMAEAQKEQVKILAEAASTRDRIINEAREQARIEGMKELDGIRKQIQAEKEDAIREIRDQVASLSVDIAEKVLRKELDDKTGQLALIDRLLDDTLVSKS